MKERGQEEGVYLEKGGWLKNGGMEMFGKNKIPKMGHFLSHNSKEARGKACAL